MADRRGRKLRASRKDCRPSSPLLARSPSPTPAEAPPSFDAPRGHTRTNSTRGQAGELTFKFKLNSQMSRLSTLRKTMGKLPDYAHETTREEVLTFLAQVDEIHESFAIAHQYLEVACPASMLEHEYFVNDCYSEEADLVLDLKCKLNKLQGDLAVQGASKGGPPQPSQSRLPTVDYDYLDWPAFNGDGPQSKRQRLEESGHRNHEYGGYGDEPRRKREDSNKPNRVLLFTIVNPVYPITVEVLHTITARCGQVRRIVVIKKDGVQAMVEFDSVETATRAKEMLHGADIYPGSCTLKIDFARPTKLNVHKNDADNWDYTTPTSAPERVRSKRCIIQSQLTKLFGIAPAAKKNAASLNRIISTVTEAKESLVSLGMSADMGDCMLVHHVSRHLDRATREAWEAFLGESEEYPTFDKLERFVSSRARALERLEDDSTRPTASSVAKQRGKRPATHAATQGHSRSALTTYPCDCCEGEHFMVLCAKFRSLSVADRRRLVHRRSLCYNCCGRHATQTCKSSHRCKQCGASHHTMLHVKAERSSRTEGTPSTSVQPH